MYKVIHNFDGIAPGSLALNKGEKVIVIQEVDANWYFGCKGNCTGFVPRSFVEVEQNSEFNEILLSIDSAISKIYETPEDLFCKEQMSAVRKLKDYRDKVVEEERLRQCTLLDNSSLIPRGSGSGHSVDTNVSHVASHRRQAPQPPTVVSHSVDRSLSGPDLVTCSTWPSHGPVTDKKEMMDFVPSDLARQLVECVRVHTEAPHSTCMRTVYNLLELLTETPLLKDGARQLQSQLTMTDTLNDTVDGFEHSQDWHRLDRLLRAAERRCADWQERSWALHEVGSSVAEEHAELAQLLTSADPALIQARLRHADSHSLLSLAKLHQMATDKAARHTLLPVFCACLDVERTCLDVFLCHSSFPAELLHNVTSFRKGESVPFVCQSLLLLAMLLSPTQSLPHHVVQLFTFDVLRSILELIVVCDSAVPVVDAVVTFLLALHPHLECAAQGRQSVVMSTLLEAEATGAVKPCMEHLLQLFNRDEDPCRLLQHSLPPVHTVRLFFCDLFARKDSAQLIYTNDSDVLVDVVNRQLNDLPPDSPVVSEYLLLLDLLIRNSQYCQRLYKCDELRRTLAHLIEVEDFADMDKILVEQIQKTLIQAQTLAQ